MQRGFFYELHITRTGPRGRFSLCPHGSAGGLSFLSWSGTAWPLLCPCLNAVFRPIQAPFLQVVYPHAGALRVLHSGYTGRTRAAAGALVWCYFTRHFTAVKRPRAEPDGIPPKNDSKNGQKNTAFLERPLCFQMNNALAVVKVVCESPDKKISPTVVRLKVVFYLVM